MACHQGYRSWEHLCVTKMKHSLTIWFCRDELSLAMLFWEDMIASISMLEVLLFLMSIWTFILNHLDLNIHATIKINTLRIMLGSIPHQKFCFYHLPTRGRASLGCLIRLQRIYNFWLFHAIILPVLDVYGLYFTLLYHFWD